MVPSVKIPNLGNLTARVPCMHEEFLIGRPRARCATVRDELSSRFSRGSRRKSQSELQSLPLVLRSLLFPKPRQVVFIGTTMVEAVSSSIAAPPTVPAVITTTVRTITEVAVLLQVPMVPVLAVTTVVVDASVTDPSNNRKSSHFTPSAMAGFSVERNSSDQPG